MAPRRAASVSGPSCQRAVLPAGAASVEQEAADQVGGRHVLVAGHRDQRLAQLPGHVFDEARLAAAGRPLQHDRQARGVGRFVQFDFLVLRLVEGFLANPEVVGGGHGGLPLRLG